MNKLLTCCLFVAALVLNGCAIAPRVDNPMSDETRPGQGTLIATLTNNTVETNYWASMRVIRIADVNGLKAEKEEPYTLNTNVDPAASFTALYLGNLPTGTYRLSQIASQVGNMSYWVNFNDKQASFVVRERETTDLGRLIVTNVGDKKVIVARSYTVTSNLDYLKATTGDYYNKVRNQKLNGWENTPTDFDKNVEAVSKRYSVDHFNPYFGDNGDTFFGSRMGVVWWNYLDKNRNWSPIDTGSLNAIFAVAVLGKTDLVVGGESGYLARYETNKGFVEMDKSNLPAGTIVFLKKYQEHGLILCVSTGKQLSFFRKKNMDAVGWEAFGQAEASFDFWWTGRTFSKIVSVGDDIAVAASPDVLYVYSAKTDTWARRQFPKNVIAFAVSYDKRLTMRGMPLPKNYYSDDLGISWHEVAGTSVFDRVVQYSDENTGYMIGPGEGSGFLSRKPDRLMMTHDHGATWTTVDDKVTTARREFAISPNGKEMLMWDAYWLDISRNGGKSWGSVRGSVYPSQGN